MVARAECSTEINDHGEKLKKGRILLSWIVVFWFFTLVCIGWFSFLNGYKQGYIKGATGQPGYELITHEDGSKSWEKSTKLKGQENVK